MISLIQASEYNKHPDVMDKIFRLRAKVFHERMGWDVHVDDGREFDKYDDFSPLYIIYTDSREILRGTLRLLPTTGPNMLAGEFRKLLPEGQEVNSPLIWECSRFAVDHLAFSERSDTAVNQATAELLCAMNEVGMLVGLEFIMAVVDVQMERVLKRAGCPCDRLGPPHKLGKVTAIAGLWEIGEELQQSLHEASGITDNVLSPAEVGRLGLAA